MAVLVTGGAGYIGSHMVLCLRRAGRAVVVVDDLSTGHQDLLLTGVPFVRADAGDTATVRGVIREHGVDAIVHFAARTQVGESVHHPRLYWEGNVVATLGLLEAALDAGVKRFVFSSTAAVYGIPESTPIAEDAPTRPINPYGETKLAIETILAGYARAYGLRYAALRYFNAAGAEAEAGLGERHEPESHLIPIVLQAALGRRPEVVVFGRDYATPDGTCIRDYVHVTDLVEAHLAALDDLARGGESGAFNLGTGTGHSVAEVIETCRAVTGRAIPVRYGERRAGDPPVLVASPRRAQQRYGWQARRSSLERIVRDAWAWHARGADAGPATPKAREEHARDL
jgi:UDP-glucose 4-epimerase